jgi:hypothetical protein
LLHRDGCDARQDDWLAAGVTDAHHVADREHLRVPGEGQIGFDGDAAGVVTLRSGQVGAEVADSVVGLFANEG